MADELNNSTTTSSDAGATPQSDTPVMGTPTSQQGATPQPKSSVSLEEAMKRIAELEHSHQNAIEERDRHRKKLSTYEEAERKAQEAALSEVERANKRASEAEQRIQQYQQQLVSAHVKLAAQAKGIIDPDMAALAIQHDLEYGDDGMPTNIDKALANLIKNKPYLAPKLAEPAAQPEPAPASSAQTASPSTPAAPVIPAMNPGRSTISAPGTTPQGGKPPRLADIWRR
jgi:hypothetical protein